MANINHFDFKNYRVFETEIAGRKLTVETGKMAQLANGSCLVRYGETVVLACATASEKPRDGIDFLPLSVDFEERMYAAGKIPGGFLRREGRPGEKAILTSRVIDRPIRPLFPKDLRNDVAISLTVMAVDPDCSHEIAAHPSPSPSRIFRGTDRSAASSSAWSTASRSSTPPRHSAT